MWRDVGGTLRTDNETTLRHPLHRQVLLSAWRLLDCKMSESLMR